MNQDDLDAIQLREAVNFSSILNVDPLLTDYYQFSMLYAYWKSNTHNKYTVFDLFFRKNPFKGEYTVFAGLSDCLRYLQNFKITNNDINELC